MSIYEANHSIVLKSLIIQACGDESGVVDYTFNLMEYDMTVDDQTGRMQLSDGESISGDMRMRNVSEDYMVQVSSPTSMVLKQEKKYVLWATYPAQGFVISPSRKPSIK